MLTAATGTRQEGRPIGADEQPLRIPSAPSVKCRPRRLDQAQQEQEGDERSRPRMRYRRIQEGRQQVTLDVGQIRFRRIALPGPECFLHDLFIEVRAGDLEPGEADSPQRCTPLPRFVGAEADSSHGRVWR
ncbi:hypothetical protein ABC795_11740 [Blastococcus sp. HT6-30]|uniref:hypothetical protein n=1 Tax=Blastococcus sp. HT6-30 TaxID=3144843 RepID=UPI0032199454